MYFILGRQDFSFVWNLVWKKNITPKYCDIYEESFYATIKVAKPIASDLMVYLGLALILSRAEILSLAGMRSLVDGGGGRRSLGGGAWRSLDDGGG